MTKVSNNFHMEPGSRADFWVHCGGCALSIAFTVALLHARDGGLQAIAAIIRDETAR
jgi:hypothetical protein